MGFLDWMFFWKKSQRKKNEEEANKVYPIFDSFVEEIRKELGGSSLFNGKTTNFDSIQLEFTLKIAEECTVMLFFTKEVENNKWQIHLDTYEDGHSETFRSMELGEADSDMKLRAILKKNKNTIVSAIKKNPNVLDAQIAGSLGMQSKSKKKDVSIKLKKK